MKLTDAWESVAPSTSLTTEKVAREVYRSLQFLHRDALYDTILAIVVLKISPHNKQPALVPMLYPVPGKGRPRPDRVMTQLPSSGCLQA